MRLCGQSLRMPKHQDLTLDSRALIQAIIWTWFVENLIICSITLFNFTIKIFTHFINYTLSHPRPLLKQIKNSAEAHIVLDCSSDKIYEVLKQAQQIGMMSDYHSYLITSLDLHTINLDEFRYGGTNITGFRLINEKVVSDVVRQWSFDDKGLQRSANLSTVRAETALMYDAVHLFAKALHDLDTSQQIDIHPISCDGQTTWQHGFSLINYMKIVEMKGLTNVIKFDHQGFRTDFVLDIIELGPMGIRKIGTWNSTLPDGINFTRTYSQKQREIEANLKNKTLTITTILVGITAVNTNCEYYIKCS